MFIQDGGVQFREPTHRNVGGLKLRKRLMEIFYQDGGLRRGKYEFTFIIYKGIEQTKVLILLNKICSFP